MKRTNARKGIPAMLKPWEGVVITLFILALYGLLVWAMIWDTGRSNIWTFLIIAGVMLMFPIGLFASASVARVTIDTEWVTLRMWNFVVKRIALKDVHTLIQHQPRGYARSPMTLLVITSDSPEQMESRGEKALGNMLFARTELRFLMVRPDWKDLCLGAGLSKRHSIWVEYSPERQQLFKELLPNCEFRISKHYTDPPIPAKNEVPK